MRPQWVKEAKNMSVSMRDADNLAAPFPEEQWVNDKLAVPFPEEQWVNDFLAYIKSQVSSIDK